MNGTSTSSSHYQEEDFLSAINSSFHLLRSRSTSTAIVDLEGHVTAGTVKISWPLWPKGSLENDLRKAVQGSGDHNIGVHISDLELLGQRSSGPQSSDSSLATSCRLLDGDIRTVATIYPRQYAKVWLDCFKCHYALWKKGIFHCDIRDSSLMFRKLPSGDLVGFLGDFDLAEGKSSPPFHPLGTARFKAFGLLELEEEKRRFKHEYWFDVESCFWVAIVDISSYPQEERVLAAAEYASWGLESNLQCVKDKMWWLARLTSQHKVTKSHIQTWKIFQLLVPAIAKWSEGVMRKDMDQIPTAEELGVDGVYGWVLDVVQRSMQAAEKEEEVTATRV
ncbi:hypothetical protein BDN72DRAFT_960256 [Pluteus cervinus]|uniref:Uncharacterized protein n=1 Tax=Pluteus cervinus TaxID=181527 RepID=A0ACD3AS17_9AGAR|nr:hypothetical protein BDN72DRAFT_960256 [Pluteus cervinus]